MAAKSKGNTFEREICKLLSKWFSHGERDDIFWRADNSGGRAKSRSRKGKNTYGQYADIRASDPIGEPILQVFTIEAKRGYSKYTFMDMLDKKPHMAMQKWEEHALQARTDSKNAKALSWMLISRRDQRESLVFIPSKIIRQLESMGAELKKIPHMQGWVYSRSGKRIHLYTARLLDFLVKVSPEIVKAII
jgi:hypothetical protein